MKSFFNDLLRLIFPQRCVLCNQILLSDSPLCEDCQKGNPRLSILRETACSSCVAPYAYEGAVRESIIRFKFNGYREYASFYGCAMAEAFREQKPDFLPDMLVAVPLSKKRLKKRGYNQAELLANAMAKHFRRRLYHAWESVTAILSSIFWIKPSGVKTSRGFTASLERFR